jgi:hypothetical protein
MRKAGLLCMFALGLAAASSQSARAADACAELQSQLVALENADRAQWEGQGSPADPYAIERQRSAVLKALAANRCRSADAKRKGRPNRLFAGIFGGKRPFRNGGFLEGRLFGDRFALDDLTVGSYRTLCVRTCDGYYFPISFSASGDELRRDENACRALCPSQDVAIYVQRNPGDEGAPMVSLAGEPYTAMSAAFRYRSEYDRECTCGPIDAGIAAAFQAFAMPPPNQGIVHPMEAAADRIIPQPPARTGEDDPDTVANRDGDFVARPTRRHTIGETVYREGPDGRVVRLVGPAATFLAE